MKIKKMLIVACAAGLAAASSASATVYRFNGTITHFSDPDVRLEGHSAIGLKFRGTITFAPEDVDTGHKFDRDLISGIKAGPFEVATPNDAAFVANYPAPGGGTHLFAGILPVNPIVFSRSNSSYTCRGAGGVSLFNDGAMSFALSCPDRGIEGESAMSIAGLGTFAAKVPESQTWTMLIGGFGFVGAASRRRTRALFTYA